MRYPLYNLALTLGAPVGLGALLWRLFIRPEYRSHLAERFGRVTPSPLNKQVIWLHAVSVGEVISAVPLVTALRDEYPNTHIVVSCGTPTGRNTAEERLASVADRVIYLAYDLPPLVRAAVRRVRPDLFVLMETELWPNLLAELGRVPVLMVNGRISLRSFPRYRLLSGLFQDVLAPVHRFLMQTPRDAEFIRRMGAPAGRVEVAGNIKYDQPVEAPSDRELGTLRRALGIPAGAPVLLAGSTHEGEETALARLWRRLAEEDDRLTLILAVRHPGRVDRVMTDLAALGIEAGRKTAGDCKGKRVVLLDTLGELAAHYPLATVAFIGGSLVPVGGHNPLEAAAVGVPVVYGPHVSNFEQPCAALENAGAAVRVDGEEPLAHTVADLLADPERRAKMGDAGRAVYAANRGALKRALARITEALPERG